ncbi:MAG: Ni/Fe hydrogenase subunit alpha [Patescibacteria group bacterium]
MPANLTEKYIAKIEGHGTLEVDWKKNKVNLGIHEGERLFEGMLVGRTLEESHWITPRICGVCPIAHNLSSLRACEDGLGIKIDKTSSLLRELMNCAQMMQSHMLHLFFLSLPDFLGIDRGTELAKKDPKSFQAALDIKKIADEIATIVGGRNVHPITTRVGGFHKFPDKKELENLLKEIKKTRKSVKYALDLCTKIEFPELKIDLELVAQEDNKILSSQKDPSDIKDYKKVITESIKDNSTAKWGKYKNREVMVGSLARQYFNQTKYRPLLDFKNPFHNNLAQAVELMLYHEEAEKILNKLLKTNLSCDDQNIKTDVNSGSSQDSHGVGFIEAPRGGLYHELGWDENGIITYANIITPTVQNLTSIEKSADALLEQYSNRSQKEVKRLLNMLVRAYDPCITCSVH